MTAVVNRNYGHPPTTREQRLEQEIKQLRSEVARLRAELDKVTNKHRYCNPIYGWVDDHLGWVDDHLEKDDIENIGEAKGKTNKEINAEITANAQLCADAWQLPDLRREIKELKEANKRLVDGLKSICKKCNATTCMNCLAATVKARGETE